MEVLNLGGNQLAEIHNKAFTKLINLRELYLDNNILVSIPSDAFKPLTNLQQLLLGGPGNSIHTIADDAFRYLDRYAFDLQLIALAVTNRNVLVWYLAL